MARKKRQELIWSIVAISLFAISLFMGITTAGMGLVSCYLFIPPLCGSVLLFLKTRRRIEVRGK